ncbi:MAG TPA: TlpA disulfide reductase family protein [Pyrinomonadaceae bacterium]|nr:TlpA disulfide reductase family protein [Pyrinomonadaceae bacterium]
MSRKLLWLGLVLSLALLSTSPITAQRKQGAKQAAAPSQISVSAIDADGLSAVIKRDETKNKPLLVNFWATWCDPCREEFPDLVKLDKQYRPKGLDFTAVSLDDLTELKTSVPKFLSDMHVTVPTYLLNVSDPEEAISRVDPQWSGALPATFLYDAQGKLVYKRLGRIKLPELTAEIEKLIGGKNTASELN